MENTEISTDVRHTENHRNLERAIAGDESAVAALMEQNAGLVRGIARRFHGRGVDSDDLIQIGSIGMLKAIRSFDISRGTAFSTYAVPLILGEIRRFLRDDGLIKVGRKQKQIGSSLLRAQEEFLAEHGREPQLHELAEPFGISDAEAAFALEAVTPVHSFSDTLGEEDSNFVLENVLETENPIERRTNQLALREVIEHMPPLWKKIVILRFYREYSQQNTAQVLGVTQVKISREEKKIIAYLRKEFTK